MPVPRMAEPLGAYLRIEISSLASECEREGKKAQRSQMRASETTGLAVRTIPKDARRLRPY